jgi:hypothetical protein
MFLKILNHSLLNMPGIHLGQIFHWIFLIIELINNLAKTKPLYLFAIMQNGITGVVHVLEVRGFAVVW